MRRKQQHRINDNGSLLLMRWSTYFCEGSGKEPIYIYATIYFTIRETCVDAIERKTISN